MQTGRMGMGNHTQACCSSRASICYWLIISLVAWGVLNLIGIYWRALHASSAAVCLFAMAVGCLANWLRNRSFHCIITGPLFLVGGVMFLLRGWASFTSTRAGSGRSLSSVLALHFCWNGSTPNVLRPSWRNIAIALKMPRRGVRYCLLAITFKSD